MKKLNELIELAKNEPIAEVPFSDEELLTMLEGPAQSATGSNSLISKYYKGALIMLSGIISLTALLLLTNPQQSELQNNVPNKEVLNPASNEPGKLRGDLPQPVGDKRKLDKKHTKANGQSTSIGSGKSNDGAPNNGSPKLSQTMATNATTQPKTNSGSASASITAQMTVTKTINGIATLELTDEELKAFDIFRDGDTYKYPMDVLPRKLKDIPSYVQTSDLIGRKKFALDLPVDPRFNEKYSIIFNNGEDDNPEPPSEYSSNSGSPSEGRTNEPFVSISTVIDSNGAVSSIPNIDSIMTVIKLRLSQENLDIPDSLGMTKLEAIDSAMKLVRERIQIDVKRLENIQNGEENTIEINNGPVIQIRENSEENEDIDMRCIIYDDTMEEGKIWREWDQITLNKNSFTRRYPNPTKVMKNLSETCAPFMASTRVFYTDKRKDATYGLKQYSNTYLNGNAPELVANGELPMGNVAEFLNNAGVKILPIRIKLGNRSTTDSAKMLYADADLWYVVDKKFVDKLPERYREPLMKELELADRIGDGALAPEEACGELEGEKSYLDICRAGSANIREVKAYPQPVSSGALNVEFNLAANETVRAELYSIDGTYIATLAQPTQMKAGKQIMQTNIQGVENGVYLLALKTELGEEVVTKIIVNK